MKCSPRPRYCLLNVTSVTLAQALAIGGAIFTAGGAFAQPAPSTPKIGSAPAAAPSVPVPTVAQKTNAAPTEAEQKLIERFILDRCAALGKENGTPRDELIAGSTTNNIQNPATSGYLLAYNRILNAQLLPLTSDANMRVRVNAAIVIARVSINSTTSNTWLMPCVEKLLATTQPEGVSLWGAKAAAAALPQAGNKTASLLQLLTGAVKAHANCSPLADEAYAALQPATLPPSKDTIDRLQDIYEIRVNLYHGAIPEDATSERRPGVYLTDHGAAGMWTISDKPRQTRTMQLITNFLVWSLAQADADTNQSDQRDQLLYAMEKTTDAVMIAAGSDTPLGSVAKAARQLPKSGAVTTYIQPVITGIIATFGTKAPQP